MTSGQAQQLQMQEPQQPPQQQREQRVQQPTQSQHNEPGVLESLGRWLDRQSDSLTSSFKDAGKGVENFGREAGVAAQTTVEGAKDAAGSVVRIPAARVVTGHEVCKVAPNGAPDCVAAATAMCKARGFEGGKSADMTTADVCPAKVYLSGRNSGPECRTETFVSRALCQ
ncbi:hypothetical protein [Pseudolabrys sp. Root1462]|uniref:hypothetical protein n=1 Tax=Pseudolabrys sp. Root1462 TaxID=1736466 RepID=UPI00138F0D87|nr:hypothetical protein [Pseudolabrys sp. Root1462]